MNWKLHSTEIGAPLLAIALSGQIAGCGGGDVTADPTIANTKEGVVQGISDGSVVSFKGIPYAAP